ncbi:MAG: hypothetical protein HQL32_09060 [Planctomycetes bacterium]|nr:hypothetical protein [Planctomycetota bacterium]
MNQSAHESNEKIVYSLLMFFICTFIGQVTFGSLCGSNAQLFTGLMALFGVVFATILLIRLRENTATKNSWFDISAGKLEFFIALAISSIIVIASAFILFFTLHIILAHTIIAPDLLSAWTSLLFAAITWFFLVKVQPDMESLEEEDAQGFRIVMNSLFFASMLSLLGVVISRSFIVVMDNLFAILFSFCTAGYSIFYLYKSFKGLMDASCHRDIVNHVTEHLNAVDPDIDIEELTMTQVGKVVEVLFVIIVPHDLSLKEAKNYVRKYKGEVASVLSDSHETHIGFKRMQGSAS